MIRRVFAVLLLAFATSAFADAVEDVRNVETAFAKAFAEQDAAKFFAFVADDATFLASRVTLVGKPEIVKRWTPFFKEKVAPFTWRPERVYVNAAGNVGLSTGPVFDKDGSQAGIYSSVWEKNANGEWKILFDGPGSSSPVDEGFVETPDGVKLHYLKSGRGVPAIIVPLDHLTWDSLVTLADRGTVIAYDPRGRGKSPAVDRHGFDYDLRDFETVRRHFNIDRVIPVGYAEFALIVATYARDHPEHIERLVQIAPVPMTGSARELRALTMPALVIDSSPSTVDTPARTWARAFPNARLLTLSLEKDDLVMNAIRAFVGGGWPDGAEDVK
ncbi:MAG TPA: alpha/beta fold hydrolase [Thermoanaerobaculia bacterium]|jgi:ketosteroid isomerase-like protein